MHAHRCTQACTCTHTSTHTCTQARTHTCTHALKHAHTCTQARTHHARKHVHTMHASTYTPCTQARTHHACKHAHTCTYTHTHEISEQFLMYHNLTICLLVLLETQISLETFGVLRKNGAFSWDVVGPSSDIQEIVGTGFKHFIKGVSP